MIKSLALVGCLSAVLSAFPLYAQSQSAPMVTLHKSLVSVGAKAGFNSSMFFSDELSVDNKRVENIQNNYKVGYFATLFCRFNLKNIILFSRSSLITFRKGVYQFLIHWLILRLSLKVH